MSHNFIHLTCESAIGLVVKYLVANEVPRVRFPDGAFLAFVAQLAARGSHNPKVAGSTPVESIFCLDLHVGGSEIQKWWFRWDSNPRPQDGLELESSALDHSATKPCVHVFRVPFTCQRSRGAMDSAPDFESGGWGVESLRDRFAIQ